MPNREDKVSQKLAQLEEYIKDLRSLQEGAEKKGEVWKAAAERRVYKAVQAALDLGQIVVAEQGMGAPASYKDVFVKLGEGGVIDEELEKDLKEMAGMRNILAHGYEEVDLVEIKQVIEEDYKDLIELGEKIREFLES